MVSTLCLDFVLDIIVLKFVYIDTFKWKSIISMTASYSTAWVYYHLSIHSMSGGHMCCLQMFAVMNNSVSCSCAPWGGMRWCVCRTYVMGYMEFTCSVLPGWTKLFCRVCTLLVVRDLNFYKHDECGMYVSLIITYSITNKIENFLFFCKIPFNVQYVPFFLFS